MEEKRVTDKRFGVKNYLIEELRRFQLSLKHKRRTMAFVANAYITINNGPTIREEIQAQEGRISIIPSIFARRFRPPRQNLVEIDNTTVRLQMDIAIVIQIRFDSEQDKDNFVKAMGDLNLSSSDEDNLSTED